MITTTPRKPPLLPLRTPRRPNATSSNVTSSSLGSNTPPDPPAIVPPAPPAICNNSANVSSHSLTPPPLPDQYINSDSSFNRYFSDPIVARVKLPQKMNLQPCITLTGSTPPPPVSNQSTSVENHAERSSSKLKIRLFEAIDVSEEIDRDDSDVSIELSPFDQDELNFPEDELNFPEIVYFETSNELNIGYQSLSKLESKEVTYQYLQRPEQSDQQDKSNQCNLTQLETRESNGKPNLDEAIFAEFEKELNQLDEKKRTNNQKQAYSHMHTALEKLKQTDSENNNVTQYDESKEFIKFAQMQSSKFTKSMRYVLKQYIAKSVLSAKQRIEAEKKESYDKAKQAYSDQVVFTNSLPSHRILWPAITNKQKASRKIKKNENKEKKSAREQLRKLKNDKLDSKKEQDKATKDVNSAQIHANKRTEKKNSITAHKAGDAYRVKQ